MSDLEARIAEVLEAHRHQPTKLDGEGGYRQSCSCGHFEIRGGDTGLPVRMSYEWIRTHQAAMLAPVIREREAAAWEEGHHAGWEEHEHPGPFVNDYWDAQAPNPYRRSNDE